MSESIEISLSTAANTAKILSLDKLITLTSDLFDLQPSIVSSSVIPSLARDIKDVDDLIEKLSLYVDEKERNNGAGDGSSGSESVRELTHTTITVMKEIIQAALSANCEVVAKKLQEVIEMTTQTVTDQNPNIPQEHSLLSLQDIKFLTRVRCWSHILLSEITASAHNHHSTLSDACQQAFDDMIKSSRNIQEALATTTATSTQASFTTGIFRCFGFGGGNSQTNISKTKHFHTLREISAVRSAINHYVTSGNSVCVRIHNVTNDPTTVHLCKLPSASLNIENSHSRRITSLVTYNKDWIITARADQCISFWRLHVTHGYQLIQRITNAHTVHHVSKDTMVARKLPDVAKKLSAVTIHLTIYGYPSGKLPYRLYSYSNDHLIKSWSLPSALTAAATPSDSDREIVSSSTATTQSTLLQTWSDDNQYFIEDWCFHDTRLFVSSFYRGEILVWDLLSSSSEPTKPIARLSHTTSLPVAVTSLAIDPLRGKTLFSAGVNGVLKKWDIDIDIEEGKSKGEGQGKEKESMREFELYHMQRKASFKPEHISKVLCVSSSSMKQRTEGEKEGEREKAMLLIAFVYSDRFSYFNISTLKEIASCSYGDALNPTCHAIFNPLPPSDHGTLLAIGHESGMITIWDLENKQLLNKISCFIVASNSNPKATAIARIAFSGPYVAVISNTSLIKVIHWSRNECLWTFQSPIPTSTTMEIPIIVIHQDMLIIGDHTTVRCLVL